MAKLQSDLTHLAYNMPKFAAEALRQTGNDIAQVAKQLAPVDTGALQRSIQVDPISETVVQVGSDVPYAPFVEYGTSRSAAQPFLTPAFHQAEETLKLRLVEAVLNGGSK